MSPEIRTNRSVSGLERTGSGFVQLFDATQPRFTGGQERREIWYIIAVAAVVSSRDQVQVLLTMNKVIIDVQNGRSHGFSAPSRLIKKGTG